MKRAHAVPEIGSDSLGMHPLLPQLEDRHCVDDRCRRDLLLAEIRAAGQARV
ncbi:MAG: hypothetical protein H0V44_02455 [Planctomycetes bacterium]|nr:hypothetical protein [Planctomycetota bacterium]